MTASLHSVQLQCSFLFLTSTAISLLFICIDLSKHPYLWRISLWIWRSMEHSYCLQRRGNSKEVVSKPCRGWTRLESPHFTNEEWQISSSLLWRRNDAELPATSKSIWRYLLPPEWHAQRMQWWGTLWTSKGNQFIFCVQPCLWEALRRCKAEANVYAIEGDAVHKTVCIYYFLSMLLFLPNILSQYWTQPQLLLCKHAKTSATVRNCKRFLTFS